MSVNRPQQKSIDRSVVTIPDGVTVAKDGTGQFAGQFASLGEALEHVGPGQRVLVLDDAVYPEVVKLADRKKYAGVTVESPREATLAPPTSEIGFLIRDVPRVTVRGFRITVQNEGAFAVLVAGQSPGVLLEGLHIEPATPFPYAGIEVEQLPLTDEDAPIRIRKCRVRHAFVGIRISGIANDFQTGLPTGRIVVSENRLEDCNTGMAAFGTVYQTHIVGNLVSGAIIGGIQLQDLVGKAGDILIANNTIIDSGMSLKYWDSQVRGERVEVCNNLILSPRGPEFVFFDSGGDPSVPRGPGDADALLQRWQISHNWWEVSGTLGGDDLIVQSRVRPGPSDVCREEIVLLSRDANSPDYLRPPADSPLANGGAGQSDANLPSYVGAIPPPGTERWDWDVTWGMRHPKTVLTVAKDESLLADFTSLREALASVTRPGTTVRVLDDSIYEEHIVLNRSREQEGLTLEAAGGAVLQFGRSIPLGLTNVGVPHVKVRGFEVRSSAATRYAIVAAEACEGFVLERLRFVNAASNAGAISIEGVSAPARAPVLVRGCVFEGYLAAVRISGATDTGDAMPCRGIRVIGNRAANCSASVWIGGQVSDVTIAGNRFANSGLGTIILSRLLDGSSNILIANNTILNMTHALVIDHPAAGVSDVTVAYNIISTGERPDVVVLGTPMPSLSQWLFRGNVRHVSMPPSKGEEWEQWVPATNDRLIDRLAFRSTEADAADFLRVAGEYAEVVRRNDSPADGTPAFVGALPPDGDDGWDWMRWAPREHADSSGK